MATRRQEGGEKFIEADNGLGWIRCSDGRYWVGIFGIGYELEKRRRNARAEPGSDTGWYLYSRNDSYFMGEFCDSTLLPAIDAASVMIVKADLRGDGYERKETEA